MSVEELTHDELEELKDSLFWQCFYDEDEVPFALKGADKETIRNCDFPSDIPDEVIFDYFGGVCFVEEDFCCNLV